MAWTATNGSTTLGPYDDGRFSFPPNTGGSDVEWNIKYTDANDCTGETTYKVGGTSFDCNNIKNKGYYSCGGHKGGPVEITLPKGVSLTEAKQIIKFNGSNPTGYGGMTLTAVGGGSSSSVWNADFTQGVSDIGANTAVTLSFTVYGQSCEIIDEVKDPLKKGFYPETAGWENGQSLNGTQNFVVFSAFTENICTGNKTSVNVSDLCVTREGDERFISGAGDKVAPYQGQFMIPINFDFNKGPNCDCNTLPSSLPNILTATFRVKFCNDTSSPELVVTARMNKIKLTIKNHYSKSVFIYTCDKNGVPGANGISSGTIGNLFEHKSGSVVSYECFPTQCMTNDDGGILKGLGIVNWAEAYPCNSQIYVASYYPSSAYGSAGAHLEPTRTDKKNIVCINTGATPRNGEITYTIYGDGVFKEDTGSYSPS